MTKTQNTKTEMTRLADWVQCKADQARADACELFNDGCFDEAEWRMAEAVRMTRKALAIRAGVAL